MTQPWNVIASMVRRLADRVDALPSIREATVTGVAPITVRFDTDTSSVQAHGSLAGTILVGARVLTVRLARYVWVLGMRGGFPYGKAQGRVQITPTAADTPTGVSIVFPVGRFTVSPRLQVTAATTSPGTVVKGVGYSGTTSAGTTIYLTRSDTTTTPVDWTAEQMTAGALMDEEIPPLRTVTCHTDGCGNRDIPVTMHCLDLVVCGACGQPITDITPEGTPS